MHEKRRVEVDIFTAVFVAMSFFFRTCLSLPLFLLFLFFYLSLLVFAIFNVLHHLLPFCSFFYLFHLFLTLLFFFISVSNFD